MLGAMSLALASNIMLAQNSKPFEVFEKQNGHFAIRATGAMENGNWFAAGADYVFESTAIGTNRWRRIMVFRHDDAVQIPTRQIRFLSDEKIAYIFMSWMYAVTTDGGNSWSVWDARSDLPGWQCCNYGLIRDVVIQSDGSGMMLCNPISGRSGEVPKLATVDFGRTWRPVN
jgi:hypothetical protein